MIEQLIDRLRQAGLDLSAEEIADALWLAERLDAPPARKPPAKSDQQIEGAVRIEEIDTIAQGDRPLSDLPLFPSDALTVDGESEDADMPSGFPFKAPAAKALPNAVSLSRALRALSRKVPSQTQVELDEEATVEQIAALRIFSPVVKPELERWLDLELVIEDAAMSFVWRKTVEEFKRKVLERLGAFRNLRMWQLRADEHRQLQLWPYIQGAAVGAKAPSLGGIRPRSPKILMHPSQRRLILLVSDCRSLLWQARPERPLSFQRSSQRTYQPTIYDWLQRWSAQGPTTLVQLLPERLWPQTELGYGDSVQLSALQAGVPNTHLTVEGATRWQLEKGPLPEPLAVPVVTLEAGPMRQWAKVVAGRGNERTPGVWFDIGLLQQFPSEGVERWAGLSAEANVNRFLASGASPVAKQLVRLMAAAPVSLSVVHLLQEKMLRSATPVHVAEVYMSGLLCDEGGHNSDGEPIYDFKEGVRDRLIKVSDPDLTIQVFTQLTEKIKEELGDAGESIESFDALLSPDPDWVKSSGLVAPFASVALGVLKALGGDYADYAAFVEENPTPRRTTTEVAFPPLQTLAFMCGALVDDEASSDDDEVDRFPPLLKLANFKVATISLPPQRLEAFEFQTAKIERERAGLFRRMQWVVKKSRAQARRFDEPLADDLTLEMVAIPGGRFLMGASDEGQHDVTVP
ncbi:MAG: SAV_2336 N-terminal domain-related protein, partial [Phormidesmis sp.]